MDGFALGEVWLVVGWVGLLGGWVGMSFFVFFFLCWFEMDFVGGG